MSQILPFRFGILYAIYLTPNAGILELIDKLFVDYGKERQFNRKEISNHLDALRAAGLIEEIDSILDEKENLISNYQITQLGILRLKYLPENYKLIKK